MSDKSDWGGSGRGQGKEPRYRNHPGVMNHKRKAILMQELAQMNPVDLGEEKPEDIDEALSRYLQKKG